MKLTDGLSINAHGCLLVDGLERGPVESQQPLVVAAELGALVLVANATDGDGRAEDLAGDDLHHCVVRRGPVDAYVFVLQDVEVGVGHVGRRLAAHPFVAQLDVGGEVRGSLGGDGGEIQDLGFGGVDVADAAGQLAAEGREGGGEARVEHVGVDGQKAEGSVQGGEHLATLAAVGGRVRVVLATTGLDKEATSEIITNTTAPSGAAVVARVYRHDSIRDEKSVATAGKRSRDVPVCIINSTLNTEASSLVAGRSLAES